MAKLKTKAELLAAFKKANKDKRVLIANRAGFNSEDEYVAHLTKVEASPATTAPTTPAKRPVGRPKKNTPAATTAKPVVHVVNIVDKSGSMTGAKLINALSGVNSELPFYRESKDVDYFVTAILFDDLVDTIYSKVPAEKAFEVKYPSRMNTTFLYDTVGDTLTNLKKTTGTEKVLVNIFTDGQDYTSLRWTASKVGSLIEEVKALGWTVTFVGTTQDVGVVVKSLKVEASNTLVHDNTARGVADAFATKLGATALYSTNVAQGLNVTKNFYVKKTGTL